MTAMATDQASAARPLVAVVIPVYNGERYLAEALASVFAQTWRPIEVIVVDDGSTDLSAEVATQAGSVRLIRQANAGVAAARNTGINATNAGFIAFLDQDDLWLPTKLEAQMRLLLTAPSLAYVVTQQERFVEPGFAMPAWIRAEHVDTVIRGIEIGALVVRRSAFDRVGLFDTRFVIASDSEWYFRAADAGLLSGRVDEPLLRRRLHDENNSRFTELGNRELRQVVLESVRRKRAMATSAGAQ